MLRLACLGATGVLAMFRLLPTSDHDKDAEILTAPQRQVHGGGSCNKLDPDVKAAPSFVPGEHNRGLNNVGSGQHERIGQP